MSYFAEHFWGEKNHGFDVLYHNMKHGQISTKELADFIRERAAIEENYAKAMVKLSKMATNGTQLGTFAPLWEVFRISSDKLALCHLELMKKLHDLIKEISRYGEEQGRVHKKSKEEVSGTLEAVQLLHGVAQLLPKSKESYHSKCQEYERLRKEGTSQKEIDKVRPRVPVLHPSPPPGSAGACARGVPPPSVCPSPRSRLPLLPAGRAQVQEGGRSAAARRGEVQRGTGRLRAEDAGLGRG
uniref:F-BAR domain-containing protein n=1 Tax=Apteryx owenii TaxID=8824 RepID=A0A8B9Q3R7_APTOW